MKDAFYRLASRVLVVDDERHIARFLQFLLNKEGYQTAVAFDGETALELCRTFEPDAVLLDLVLPGISGLDVLKTIHDSHVAGPPAPVVMLLTGMSLQDLPSDIMHYGVAAHCAKPVAPSTLLRHLQEHGLFGYAGSRVGRSSGAPRRGEK